MSKNRDDVTEKLLTGALGGYTINVSGTYEVTACSNGKLDIFLVRYDKDTDTYKRVDRRKQSIKPPLDGY